MRLSGIPVIRVAGNGGPLDNTEGRNALLNAPDTTSNTLSGIVAAFFAKCANACHVWIETARSRVTGGEGSNGLTQLHNYAQGVSGVKKIVLKPVPGQTGTQLEWDVLENVSDLSDYHTESKEAITALVAPATPTYNVSALCQRIVASLPRGKNAIVAVNQHYGTVTIFQKSDGTMPATELCTDAEITAYKGTVVELTGAVTPDAPAALKFEGGTV